MKEKIEKSMDHTLKLSVKKEALIGAGLLLMLSVLFVSFGIVYVHRGQQEIARSQEVLTENALLKSKITQLNMEIDSIMIKLEIMENWEDDIRSRKNFEEINKEVREMGTGGIPQIDSEFSLLDEASNVEYNILLNRINHLRSKVDFDLGTHKELHKNHQLRESLYRATPSIYPTFGRISSGYGWRTHPISGKRTFHHGVDLSNKSGTPIYATADGVVKLTTRTALMGRYIKLGHEFGFETIYGHLKKILVKKGQQVKRGQIIALMGNTGDSTGSHLHYEVHRYNRYRNPAKYFVKEQDEIAVKK